MPDPIENFNLWVTSQTVENEFIAPDKAFPIPDINIIETDDGETRLTQYAMPFIKINKQGFLNYYTETP